MTFPPSGNCMAALNLPEKPALKLSAHSLNSRKNPSHVLWPERRSKKEAVFHDLGGESQILTQDHFISTLKLTPETLAVIVELAMSA